MGEAWERRGRGVGEAWGSRQQRRVRSVSAATADAQRGGPLGPVRSREAKVDELHVPVLGQHETSPCTDRTRDSQQPRTSGGSAWAAAAATTASRLGLDSRRLSRVRIRVRVKIFVGFYHRVRSSQVIG